MFLVLLGGKASELGVHVRCLDLINDRSGLNFQLSLQRQCNFNHVPAEQSKATVITYYNHFRGLYFHQLFMDHAEASQHISGVSLSADD